MRSRPPSSIRQRVELLQLTIDAHLTHRVAGQTLGYSLHWSRKWTRRFRHGDRQVVQPMPSPGPQPLTRFAPLVTTIARAYRTAHPGLGARRVLLALQQDPRLVGESLPSARTLHRLFVASGQVKRHLPPDHEPVATAVSATAPHAVWEIDHQDHLALTGLEPKGVLQNIRDPATGVTIAADLFPGPRGAQSVAADTLLDAIRRRFMAWGRPGAFQVDHAPWFLGRPQRQFPSRFELVCAGWGIQVQPIRPGRPTDNGAVERLHRTIDGFLVGPSFASWEVAQAALDQHVDDLNTRFPSRARGCHERPPLVVTPTARHSGRPYDPAREWERFDQAAVDRLLAGWTWHRQVGKRTAQISFGHINIPVPPAHRGAVLQLTFDPTDRQVVISSVDRDRTRPGVEIRRFSCPAFTKEVILGSSQVAWRPDPGGGATLQ